MLDLIKVQRAIEVVESNAGANNYPRLEASYVPNGIRLTVQGKSILGNGRNVNAIVKERWEKWGMASACSFGAAQILYHTAADLGFMNHPAYLWVDPTLHDKYVQLQLAKIVARGAKSLDQVADAWNSGTHLDQIVPTLYMDAVAAAYAKL